MPMAQASDVAIPIGTATLFGSLRLPHAAHGLVLFAHGSGSSRLSPRNNSVAQVLADHGLATLLFDLLTAVEEQTDLLTAALRFDIALLADRLCEATRWAQKQPSLQALRIGYFGASTGAAAALIAAARIPEICAVVSRGGRPDLAGSFLNKVRAPTLLIVGGQDPEVLELNRAALTELPGEARLEVVPGATHLFEEPGTLEQVADLARAWFEHHLSGDNIPRLTSRSRRFRGSGQAGL